MADEVSMEVGWNVEVVEADECSFGVLTITVDGAPVDVIIIPASEGSDGG